MSGQDGRNTRERDKEFTKRKYKQVKLINGSTYNSDTALQSLEVKWITAGICLNEEEEEAQNGDLFHKDSMSLNLCKIATFYK